jgi:hypothetical protein
MNLEEKLTPTKDDFPDEDTFEYRLADVLINTLKTQPTLKHLTDTVLAFLKVELAVQSDGSVILCNGRTCDVLQSLLGLYAFIVTHEDEMYASSLRRLAKEALADKGITSVFSLDKQDKPS